MWGLKSLVVVVMLPGFVQEQIIVIGGVDFLVVGGTVRHEIQIVAGTVIVLVGVNAGAVIKLKVLRLKGTPGFLQKNTAFPADTKP